MNLEAFRGEGRLDSSGVFTLDDRRADAKLHRYRLPNPHLVLCKAVQAAVAGGARSVALGCDLLSLSARWDGPPLALERVGPGGRDDLSQAVFGGLAEIAREVWLEAAGMRAQWTPAGRWLSRCRPAGNLFQLERNWNSYRRGFLRPDLEERRCRYAPVPVSLNGRRLSLEVWSAPGAHRAERYLLAEEGDDDPLGAPAVSYAEQPPRLPGRLQGRERIPCRAVLFLTRGASRLTFVRHGVVVHEEPSELGFGAVVSCQGLTLDLTGFGLVKDAAYERCLARLKAESV